MIYLNPPACLYAPFVQRCLRVVHVRRIRALLRAVPHGRVGASIHERVLGPEGQRDRYPESFLSADWVCRVSVDRRVRRQKK